MSIYDDLKLRDDAYAMDSKDIIDAFRDKLSKAFQLAIKDDRDVEWVTIDSLTTGSRYVKIYGYLTARIDDILTLDTGEVVKVTEEGKKNFPSTIILIYLPSELLETGTVEEMTTSIEAFFQLVHILTPEGLLLVLTHRDTDRPEELLADDDFVDIITTPKEKFMEIELDGVQTIMGFDTASLTKDHIKSIMLFEAMGYEEVKH